MTYSTESVKVGHIPTVFIELDMDFCALRSGVGACTATETGDAKCYNTYSTCNDTANFDKTTKTYLFSEQNADLPIGLSTIPLLKSVSFASQEITPNKGLGVRGSVTARFLDAPWPDTEIDPYWQERTYDTTNSGTFWGKFKARNPYYENRVLRVRRGYLTSVFDFGNFVDSVYIIDKLDGISKNDDVTIVAKDILKLADDKKALFPLPSNGVLSANITDSATSFTVSPSGIGAEYPSSGKVSISGEVMSFTRSSDVFTVTRAQSNTTAEAHNLDDTVQLVGVFSNEKIHDVIYELLTTYTGVDAAYIDYAAWNTESTDYLAGVWSAEITEPTGINTLLGELTEQGLCRIWWDELDQEIKFRAVKPLPEGLTTLSDDNHFLTKSLDAKTDTAQRIATVLVYFAQKKPTEKLDDLKNYEQRVVTSDTDASSALQYGTNPIRKLYSRWFKKTSLGRVNALSDSLLKTYRNPPRILEFNLTPALQLKVGDLFYANTRKIQSLSGVNESVPMEIIYAQPTDRDDIKYKAQEVSTAIPLSNSYTIYISADDLDVNLYDVFVNEYGAPSIGIFVDFIIQSGVLISASTTSNYALTNPSTWPADCTLTLVIESGAVVAGRGGDGGDGGNATRNNLGVWTIVENGAVGTDGGNAILADYEISIDNSLGVITGGAGGGGGGGASRSDGGSLGCGGGGGGGGWPFGVKGIGGHVTVTTGTTDDGADGTDAGITTAGTGGVGGSLSGFGEGNVDGGTGGAGGKYNTAAGNGGNGTRSVGSSPITTGATGGALGDAVNGNSYITWTATGTRYGTIV